MLNTVSKILICLNFDLNAFICPPNNGAIKKFTGQSGGS